MTGLGAGKRVAVIGGGLGGMVAAGELAAAGAQVVLFEASDRLGGKARSMTVDGVTLDTGPTLLTMPGLVRETFRRLDAADLLPPLLELPLQCRYEWDGGLRFDTFSDLERTLAAATAVFGAREAEGLRGFYAEAEAIYRAAGEPYLEAPFEGLGDFLGRVLSRGVGAAMDGIAMGTLDGLARKHLRTPELRQFVGRFATYVGASPYEASAAFALIPHLERVQGCWHVKGGMGGLARALERAIRRLGVEIRSGARVRWSSDGGAHRCGPDGEQEPFEALVINADPLASLHREDEPLSLSGYVLLLEADRRLSLPHHTILFGGDYRAEFEAIFSGRLPADPTLYLCHPAASDPSMAPLWRSGLFVMVNAPVLGGEPDEDWNERAERLRAGILGRLKAHFPELAGASLRVLGERTPVSFAGLGAPRGSLYGFLPHGRLGAFRRPRMRGGPGVFYCGGGTHPGGGVPMVMLSGRFAAELAGRHLARSA